MPLLVSEPIVHPEGLFDAPHDRAGAGCWWAFFTRPRAEKALARRLRGRGIAHFLPLYWRRWINRGRAFNSYLPLFPGYLFVFGDQDARLAALQTNLVASALQVPDQGRLHADLAWVYQLLAAGAPVTPEDRLQPGAKVLITRGPFAGLEGTVLRRGEQMRFVVEVQLLQRGVSLDIAEWMFEPVGPA